MSEKPMFTERPKLKEVTLPVDTVKELADLIPKPENQYHYRIIGTWKPNQEVFQVNEGDGVLSDYSFPEKSDMSVVQFASRKTYVKELNIFGNVKDKKVQFDRATNTWKKVGIFQQISGIFHKADNIPGQVVEEDGVFVLHTMEAKRPIGKTVQEAQLSTLQDAKVDLGLKYKHMEHALRELRMANRQLEMTNATNEGMIRSLNAQLLAANINTKNPLYEQHADFINTHLSTREEPPTYGNTTPSETSAKKSEPLKRTPPKKDEKLDKRGDEVLRQFEENVKKKEENKRNAEAKLDEEYKKWITNHPNTTKEEFVAMKQREEAERKKRS